MFGLFKSNRIELEFRSNEGKFMFNLKGDAAEGVHRNLCSIPELRKTTKRLAKRSSEEFQEFIIFECVKQCGYIFGDSLEVILNPGDYIKIIQ